MNEPIVKLDEVTKTYPQGNQTIAAVAGLSLQIEPKEFTALCGPSGSGKTTTLNLIGALDVPTSGTIVVEGHDISHMSRAELATVRRDRIGFVFQAYNLIPVLTAYENAEFVLALKKVPADERRRRVLDMLDAVGLAGLEDRRPDELSGGQQQRVAIARAIVGKPAIVLADEPTANVDSENAEALLDIMQDLNETHGVTFLFSTHDERVMRRAKRIVHLRDGALDHEENRA
ncbi:MAG: ABC transporter ATP-binding protein [Deltaproteobacteria bacterium]